MANVDIRICAKQHGVRLWEISDALGYSHESKLSRRLRHELSAAEKRQILTIIEEISRKRGDVV